MQNNIESLRALLRSLVAPVTISFALLGTCHPASGVTVRQEIVSSYSVSAAQTALSTTRVYLYQNGILVEAPNAYAHEGGVYTDAGLLGIIGPAGNGVYDSANNLLGYVVYGEDPVVP